MASLSDFLRNGLNDSCENPYVYDPFIKGTFFGFLELPSALGLDDWATVFSRNLLSVTLPSPSISELQARGVGGLSSVHPGEISLGHDLPVRVRETFDLDVVKGLTKWHNIIRNWKTGYSGVELRSVNYKGTFRLILTDPSGKHMKLGLKFIGVWPPNDPLANLGADINDISIAELDYTFKFDRICEMDFNETKKYLQDLEG